MIIALANQKAGSGKTKIRVHLATMLGRDHSVIVLDADPQCSALAWIVDDDRVPVNNDGGIRTGLAIPVDVASVAYQGHFTHELIQSAEVDYDYVVIDCPPSADLAAVQSILLVIDQLVVPVVPSATDIRAAGAIADLATQANEACDASLQCRFMVNQNGGGRVLSRVIEDALTPTAPVMSSRIGERESYLQCDGIHETAWSLGDTEARRDFKKPIQELINDE